MNNIIQTENLTKHYGKVKAVVDLSLSIGKGEIYGFVGLNGAGKTTTIRMLLGMINPKAGSAYLNGRKVSAGNHDLWHSVGYLVEIPYSYPDLTVSENLEIVRRLRFVPDAGAVGTVIDKLQLGSYRDRLAKNLSQGNAQRLGLAKALLHNPDILILDEPANGLDPAGIVEIRELLSDLAFNRGVTVFISSHILGEISRFATRIGIIHEGRLINEIQANKLDGLRHRRLLIKALDMEGALSALKNAGHAAFRNDEGSIEISEPRTISAPEVVSAFLVKAGFPPSALYAEEEDLESYFLRVIGKEGGAV